MESSSAAVAPALVIEPIDTDAAPAPAPPEPVSDTPAVPVASSSSAPAPPPAQVVAIVSTSPTGKTRDWHAKYWKPVLSDGPSRALAMDLPESYFQPTASELQGAFAGMERKRANLVDAPMLTKALRDKETDSKSREKANRWPQTRIRIRFADRSQLEGVFQSTESLAAIYEFTKFALAEEHRLAPFLLYQTPPRREFRKADPAMKGKSLMDLELTPSSVFYIKFDDDALNQTGTPPLLPVLLAAAADFPVPVVFDPTAAAVPAAKLGGEEPVNKAQKLGSTSKTMPNWMKKAKSGK